VNPLETFVADGDRLCFDDLLLSYNLAKPSSTSYTLQAYDAKFRRVGTAMTMPAGANGHTCAPLRLATGGDRYTIMRIDTQRTRSAGTIYVHVAADPKTGAPRVIGIWRP